MKKAGVSTPAVRFVVEHRGIEPLTYGLQSRRSPS